MSTDFDVIVIGAGPGGYVAAIRAAQLGQKVAIVEREHLGGVCLNWGCIPTKALLRSAEVYHNMQHADAFGLSADNIKFDIAKVVARSRGVAKQLSSGIAHLMKKNKVTVVNGSAKLLGGGKVAISNADGKNVATHSAKNIIIATGARPRALPALPVDGKLIWSARHAMTPESLPKRLLVVGSGAIGIEFASFYRTMGSEVTVVEFASRILPVEDEEVAVTAKRLFEKQGMKIVVNAQVTKATPQGDAVQVVIAPKDGAEQTVIVDRVIVAVGVVPNTEELGLEALNIARDPRGHIVTNGLCHTNVAGVYALGDVTAPPWLAHKASHEGIIAAETIAGKHPHAMIRENIPGCTYCMPQIASVGLTEAAAKAAGHTLKVGRFPFVGNGKAAAMGESDGFIKTIFDAKTGQLLGAHLIGAEVTELVHSFVLGKTLETTEEELMQTVFPHPTLSEMIHESVLDAYGRVIHF